MTEQKSSTDTTMLAFTTSPEPSESGLNAWWRVLIIVVTVTVTASFMLPPLMNLHRTTSLIPGGIEAVNFQEQFGKTLAAVPAAERAQMRCSVRPLVGDTTPGNPERGLHRAMIGEIRQGQKLLGEMNFRAGLTHLDCFPDGRIVSSFTGDAPAKVGVSSTGKLSQISGF